MWSTAVAVLAAGILAFYAVVLVQQTRSPLDAPPCPRQPSASADCVRRLPAHVDRLPVSRGSRRHDLDDRALDFPVRLTGLPGGPLLVHFTLDQFRQLRPRLHDGVTAALRGGQVIAVAGPQGSAWTNGNSPRARLGRLLLVLPVLLFALLLALLGRGPRSPRERPTTAAALARRLSLLALVVTAVVLANVPNWGPAIAYTAASAWALVGMVAAQDWRGRDNAPTPEPTVSTFDGLPHTPRRPRGTARDRLR